MKRKLLIVLCLATLIACQRATEDKPPVSQAPSNPNATETPRQSGPSPNEAELRAAVKRNYEEVVIIDDSRSTPFMIGDFNGDSSEDIAVVVKPQKLSDLNSEYVNWILEDPHHLQQTSMDVRKNDLLLAVIHGHKSEGWRHEFARQTYLLKNAVGTDLETMSIKQLRSSGESRLLPALRGDVIREKLNGGGGIIYWTGGKYAWYPIG
ncbi:MAG TPA: hypothetical protein VM656_13245 [Pyrinomonadaceae bacterium]|jgi:hypothetical protein|nr:hypothetical protein [Pyrinomonadaceae bacterium]